MKFRVLVIDIHDKSLEEMVVSGDDPVHAYNNFMNDDPEGVNDLEDDFREEYEGYLKVVGEGKWMMDLVDGLVFFNHIDD